MSDGCYRLTETADASLTEVGAKALNLGRLRQAGFRVPDGFVVPPSLPGADIAPVVAQFGDGPFAVRSSGVREDGAEASMAGQYESMLDVVPGSIPAAVSKVRHSARHGEEDAIPVLVQVMIEPTCAGAAFTADPITGDRDTTVVTATRGLADRLLSGEVPGDEWQIESRKARPVRRPEDVLNKKLARRVARAAEEIAREFGTPQDVEWAWDGHELWVVQARPMTGLPDELDWEPPAPGIYHRSLRFGEWIPQPVTPLFESWLLPRMEHRLHERLYELIGQVAPEPHHVVVNGWYYYSLNWLPVPGVAFTRNFINILGRLRHGWRDAAPMFPQTVRFGYQEREDEWRNEVLPQYRHAVSRAEDEVETAEPAELIEMVDGLATQAGSYFASIATVAGSAYKFEEQLAHFWNRHLKERLGVSHMVALQGFELPGEIQQTPRLETLDWAVPPAKPGPSPIDIDDLKTRRAGIEREAEEALTGSPRRLRKFRRLLEEAQHVVPVREEQLGFLSLPWPVMRRAVQRLGEALASMGVIESVDDVFYVTRSEVLSLLENAQEMDAAVGMRREDRNRAAKRAAPLWVGDVPRIVEFIFSYNNKVMGAVRSDTAIVHGVPASPGRASGRVRVIRDSSQFDEFEDGEILVAPLTAPAWTDLFERAAAVVTDVGSALAHASIVAREYGIPAVVGCGDATARLMDGQMVTVDGSAGNVEHRAVDETREPLGRS